MKLLLLTAALLSIGTFQNKQSSTNQLQASTSNTSTQKIQVAILLDVSNSMDGLIDQAKAQLWNMVNTVGKAKCDDGSPTIEIALYEYGRSTNNKNEGYVKQISPFTSDLDLLSEHLFKLTTNGGDEFCSHVIYTSLDQLNWDMTEGNYKVIFIAGNEEFNQGSVTWKMACAEAKKKGVIVNTIYCGDKMQGIRENWNLGSECSSGSYTNINQDAKIQDIETPYDSALFVMNEKLNSTYVAYGVSGASGSMKQEKMDKENFAMSKSVAASRVSVKGKSTLYNNAQWDLVDAAAKDSTVMEKVDTKTLPEELKNKSRTEVKQIVSQKSEERGNIQKEISKLSTQRQEFIAVERKKNSTGAVATLETEIEKIIKQQVKLFNMVIE